MTEQEAAALAQILARLPLSQAELLWINALMSRLVTLGKQTIEEKEHDKRIQQPDRTTD